MRSFSFFLLLLVLSAPVRAAELADLGQGLGYLRVHSLDAAVKPLLGGNAIVLDLRQATVDPDSVAPFSAALSARPAGSRLFVLVGPDTPARLAETLKGNLITLGIKGAHPEPQVIVQQTAEADRSAYAAFESGTGLAPLISGKIEKERFDEATLVQEFKNGHPDAQPPALPALRSPENGGSKVDGPAAPPASGTPALPAVPPTDRVLQRAVHLHRALLALKHG